MAVALHGDRSPLLPLVTSSAMKLLSPLALAPIILVSVAVHGAEPPRAVVTLQDGRTIAGLLDDATDDRALWIRLSEQRIRLAVSYPWNEVAGIEVDGTDVTEGEILASPDEYLAEWPRFLLFDEQEPLTTTYREEPIEDLRRATATSFGARLANWDRDVEPDGYEVAVRVLDEYGRPMAVRGTLSARLVGERNGGPGTPTVPAVPTVLERWSKRIDFEQFVGGQAIFRLPFRAIFPERELDIQPGGILEIEVGAFGHGRMAASAAVPLRQFNAIRDRYEQSIGSRFFPGERHRHWSHADRMTDIESAIGQ